jgi:hypothetical protein
LGTKLHKYNCRQIALHIDKATIFSSLFSFLSSWRSKSLTYLGEIDIGIGRLFKKVLSKIYYDPQPEVLGDERTN